MSERFLTGVEMQEQLLAEARRTREVLEGIRNLLTIWMIVMFLGAIIFWAVSL